MSDLCRRGEAVPKTIQTQEAEGSKKMHEIIQKLKKNSFLFQELVKRDFKQKYKRTALGMLWSVLNPLLTLLVMKVIFTRFYGRNQAFYTTYLFAGNLVYSYFRESTTGGMNSLMANAHIFSKIKVPKYLFLLSKNVSAVINFGLTLTVFFVFAVADGITFRWSFFMLFYPIVTLTLFNIGMGMILSALYIFFRDIHYIYDVFTMLLMYASAIFYYVDNFPGNMQRLFLLNPVYCYIKYIRCIVIDGNIPSIAFHGLILLYAAIALSIGALIYKTQNTKFLYYV